MRAVAGSAAGWDLEAELAAAAVNELRVANYLFTKANSKAGTNVPEPDLLERPEADGLELERIARGRLHGGRARGLEPERRTATGAEIAAWVKASGGTVRFTPRRSD